MRRLRTPALLLDRQILEENLRRMQEVVDRFGVRLRPHMKTAKSAEVARLAVGPNGPVTVSTLAEAEFFADRGHSDILYAVGVTPDKLQAVHRLRRGGADVQVILDSPEVAAAVAGASELLAGSFKVWLEVDCDGRRAGLGPDDPRLAEIARRLSRSEGVELAGVMTHGGGSYLCRTAEELEAFAESERAAVVQAAEAIRAAGVDCPGVSLGATPTVSFARSMAGVTEVRPGVYMFQDLFQAGLGVCSVSDIAVSVLASVIGHRSEPPMLVIDAGGLALSLDRSTASQPDDCGFGLVADETGELLPDLFVERVTQEHGMVASRRGVLDPGAFPVGHRLRVLPNHACMTAAAHDRYVVIEAGRVTGSWERCSGW